MFDIHQLSALVASCGVAICVVLCSILYARRSLRHLKNLLEAEKKSASSALMAELAQRRKEFLDEMRRERQDVDKLFAKAHSRSELVAKKEARLDELKETLEASLSQQKRELESIKKRHDELDQLRNELIARLEQTANISRDEAKQLIIKNLEDEARHSAERLILKVEEDARQTAKDRAASIIVSAMQRIASDQVNESTVGVVHLPSEEMKGRIIGKEGRNIKALEMATGMEFIIGEAPEIITISGFNPIRREVARRSLEKLILDGRINPTRIEETVEQVEREVEEIIDEYGRDAVMSQKIQGLKPEMVSNLGKLHFRTSFSQNVLQHSIEVGCFGRIIAEELGCERPDIALRGGLLHDIGKALSAELEGPHALIGADLARRCGEDPLVVNAIAAHHEEVPFESIYAPIVMIADTISACRPGARRETLTTYIKRLEKLEELAHGFTGVKRAYAVQAGREIRVIVEESVLSDDGATFLARDLARRIEEDMAFPGQIKVNVIREKRTIEYAR